jgi:hypothetical protein
MPTLEAIGCPLEAHGKIEALLPWYMVMLPQVILDAIVGAPNRSQLIIAAGATEPGAPIVFVTGDHRIMEVDREKHGLPHGDVEPVDDGNTLLIGGTYEVANDWTIANAKHIGTSIYA